MTRWLLAILVAAMASLIHLGYYLSPLGARFEPVALDIWSGIRGQLPVPDEIVIVAIDEQSYGVLDVPLNQSWPRELHTKLLNSLSQFKPRKVAFDVLFLGESPQSKIDQNLAAAVKELPVTLAADSIVRDQSSSSGSFKIEEVLLPLDLLLNSGGTPALINLPEDWGYIRRFNTTRTSMTKGMPTLSESAVDFDGSDGPTQRDFINFYGPRDTITTIPYYKLIDDQLKLPPQLLKDKIVFVGLKLQTDVGPSQKDVFMTPFGRLFGMEIHATAAANLLDGNWIKRASATKEILLLSLFCLLGCFLLLTLRPLLGLVTLVVVITSWSIVSYLAFTSSLFIPGIVLSFILLPLVFMSATLYYYFVTRRSQLQMVSAFEHYLSPEMARSVAKDKNSLSLGGEKIWATAMFTDIEGFTAIAENMPAEQVSQMLNSYFSEVMEVVFQNQGTLLKFIGDAIFVIWGAPIKISDHASKACATALAIQDEVKKFNSTGRFPPLNTRIGIHTGPMLVGNLGSSKRFDYTAIGDSVNLASRLEALNKYFGSYILISGSVNRELAGACSTTLAGSIKVVGKNEVIELYFLHSQPLAEIVAEAWQQGLASFRAREWQAAVEKFTRVKEREPQLLKAAQLYLDQIAVYTVSPPSPQWAGELSFTAK